MRRKGSPRGGAAALGLGLALAVALAAPATAQQRDSAPARPAAGPEDGLPPAGLGRLTQDDLAVRLRDEQLEIRFVPLDERVLRLLASDAYQSLHTLAVSRRAAVDSIGRRYGVGGTGVALVSFFGRQPGVRFDPQGLTVTGPARVMRPIGFVSLSPLFQSQQLDVRQSASALFVFEEELPVTQEFTVAYGALSSDDWGRRLTRFERERARVAARATAQPDRR